jgi:hypothetical protein
MLSRTAFATIPLSFSSRTWGTVEVTVLNVVAHNQGMAIGDAGFCATYCVPRLDGSGSYVRTRHVALERFLLLSTTSVMGENLCFNLG